MDMQQLALEIATKAHEGQTDKAGVPYINHPIYVASLVDGNDEKVVALLHDVLEDSDISKDYLAELFPEHIVKAVEILTRDENVDYFDYIKSIKDNPLAVTVKLADLSHNMMSERLLEVTDRDMERLERYRLAHGILAL